MTLPPEKKQHGGKASKALPRCVFDPEDYLDQTKDFDLDEEQARALLETLWNIMSAFVDMSWGVDNLSYVLPEIFGQKAKKPDRFVGENQHINPEEER